jgi:hypothetical protein
LDKSIIETVYGVDTVVIGGGWTFRVVLIQQQAPATGDTGAVWVVQLNEVDTQTPHDTTPHDTTGTTLDSGLGPGPDDHVTTAPGPATTSPANSSPATTSPANSSPATTSGGWSVHAPGRQDIPTSTAPTAPTAPTATTTTTSPIGSGSVSPDPGPGTGPVSDAGLSGTLSGWTVLAPGTARAGNMFSFFGADHTPADQAAAWWWSGLTGVIPVVLHSDPLVAVARIGQEWVDYPQLAARLGQHLASDPSLAGLPILLVDCRGAAKLQHATELAAEIRLHTSHRVFATIGNVSQGVRRRDEYGRDYQIVLTQHFEHNTDYSPRISLPDPTEPLDPNLPTWDDYNLDGSVTPISPDLSEVLRWYSTNPAADVDHLAGMDLVTHTTWIHTPTSHHHPDPADPDTAQTPPPPL